MANRSSGRKPLSLQNSLLVLAQFGDEQTALDGRDIERLAGISASTAKRYLGRLSRLGYVSRAPHGRYRLAELHWHTRSAGRERHDPPVPVSAAQLGIFEMANLTGLSRHPRMIRVVLERLREQTGYTVSMGVLDGSQVTYVHRFFGHRRDQYKIDGELRVGAHVPAYCTALGKIMLASLPSEERRERVETLHLVPHGPCSITVQEELLAELDNVNPQKPLVSSEEFIAGGRSVAAPIKREPGELPMAIDVTVPSAAYTPVHLRKEVGPLVMRTASLLERP